MASHGKVVHERLRFAPQVLMRLGEELVPRPEQGIIELVRNSYDADAKTCRVELRDTGSIGGTVQVTDDGSGLTLDEIRGGWLVLGRSRKSAILRTSSGRLPVGDKGLGRLAALRLGKQALLTTRPASEPGREYRVLIEWSRFDAADVVEDVELNIETGRSQLPPGTAIELQQLRSKLTSRDVSRLARSLVLLSDPFDKSSGFNPRLIAPDFAELEKLVRRGYLDKADFYLHASISESGRASAELRDWRNKIVGQASHLDLTKGPTEISCPAATFELWSYLLDSKRFAPRHGQLSGIKEWLGTLGGVYLYHRGLRVYPYGDLGHDWLDLNLARSRSPEHRPSTNNSVGRVVVTDPDHVLLQKTDRSGFIETEQFEALRSFCTVALGWMATTRQRLWEEQRTGERARTPRELSKATASLTHVIERVPVAMQSDLKRAVHKLEQARLKELRSIREDLELYRTLGTVGTTVSVFAHESGKPVTQIQQMARTVERRGKQHLADKYDSVLGRPVAIIQSSAAALKTYAHVPVMLLRRNRRAHGRVNVHECLRSIGDLFAPFLADNNISILQEHTDQDPVVFGTSASIDAIVSNLLTNAIAALTGNDGPHTQRLIIIRTDTHSDSLLLTCLDNGPGIRDVAIEDIWLPGRTTKPDGTGLGLTIVRDVAMDLGGSVTATASGELGGAEFLVTIPLAEGGPEQ